MSYTSIPSDMARHLSNPDTPWHVNEELFASLQFTPKTTTLYKTQEVTEDHPEWRFVHAYFDNDIPQNRMISRIFCVHNPVNTKAFEQNISSMEVQAKDPYLAPKWRVEEPHPLREKMMQVWEKEVSQFSPFFVRTRKADGSYKEDRYEKIKILPLWHGSSAVKCDAIIKEMFTRFGKHEYFEGGVDDVNIDIGIFGDGIYFTNSAKYAAEIYGPDHLLLSWVSMREPFPIIKEDIKRFEGKGGYRSYNAHYTHVTLFKDEQDNPIRDGKGKLCHYPVIEGEMPRYNEVVVFPSVQTLPRFWVELAVSLVRNPALKQEDLFLLEKQREIALQQAFGYIEQAHLLPLHDRFSAYAEAMGYFAIAIKIAQPQTKEEMHRLASKLLIGVAKSGLYHKDSLELPSETATGRYEQKLKDYRKAFNHFLSRKPQDLAVIRAFQKERLEALKELFQHILKDALIILGRPPCGYDIREMGSVAREEITPFSELKLIIFIQEESCQEYFKTLLQILNLQITSLGENPLGFHIDLRASSVRALAQVRNFSKSVSLARGPSDLVVEEESLESQTLAIKRLKERTCEYKRFWGDDNILPLQNMNDQYADPLNLLLADLGLYFKVASANTLDILETLQEKGVFTKQTTLLFKVSLSVIYALRIQMHVRAQSRQDEISLNYKTSQDQYFVFPYKRKQLEKIYWLILRPLYNRLNKALENPEHFRRILTQVDLVQDSFEEAITASDPITFIPALTCLASLLAHQNASREDYLHYFEILSQDPSNEPLRSAFFDALQKEEVSCDLIETLSQIPNRAGYRLSYAKNYAKFYESLTHVTQTDPESFGLISSVKVICGGLPARHLKKEAIEAILDEAGAIKKTQHTDSAHAVASTQGLYFKQMPSQPLMEYAIHNLFFRLGGLLTPASELVRLEVEVGGQKLIYPVLISQEIPGETLKEALKKSASVPTINNLTWFLLASILTRPGDGRLSNYVLNGETLFCIDNDISFIEPVVRRSFSTEINFCSALFCLPSRPLDPKVLKQFISLNADAILDGWLTDVIETEKKYAKLFTEEETKKFYEADPNNRFTATILFKEGTLITLNLQFLQLQKYLHEQLQKEQTVRVTDLLTQLISITDRGQSSVGSALHLAYTKATGGTTEERLKIAIDRKEEKSLTSAQYHQKTFGKIPSWDEIQKRKAFSPTKAKEELLCSLLKFSGVLQIKNDEGKLSLQGDFSSLKDDNIPNEVRQHFVLKALQFLAEKDNHTHIVLRHCTVLNTKSLELFLNKTVEHLDISYCPQIRSLDIVQIQKKCPHLKRLYVGGCSQLDKIDDNGILFDEPLVFENLEELSVKGCSALRSIKLKAPKLKSLSAKTTGALSVLELNVLKFPKLELTDSSCSNLKINDLQEICHERGDFENAKGVYIYLLEHLKATFSVSVEAGFMLYQLGWISENLKLYQEARAHYERSLDIFRRLNNPSEIRAVLRNLIVLLIAEGNLRDGNNIKTYKKDYEALSKAREATYLLKSNKEVELTAFGRDKTVIEYLSLQTVVLVTGSFGRTKWLEHFGEIGEEPLLPPDIGRILASPCPFWPGKTVQETHKLVLLPKTVNGVALTLNSLQKLVKHPKQGPATQYRYYWDEAKKSLGDQSLSQSSWVLMTKDILPDSRSKSYADQCHLVERWSQKTRVPYQVPGILEAATCILLEHVQSGTRLYSDNPYTYTRCHEKVAGWQMAVGGFAASGLGVVSPDDDVGSVGVASLRKL